ncbi:lipopolysaccharide assembly outer membrane protein LptD [Candidatus Termititenax spirochaetophilus]|uniref:Lipopolysaccharide assembly outer membrane protein LptD n=1 Tax=Candidatus Termititenax spirochaetophilus TaxID=2218522 RepID=A0A388T8B3_9BACT|nr:lipopolysaccharide assembly outer membrane protein LptD [Candidatus Termititenax spirochaetophilus]
MRRYSLIFVLLLLSLAVGEEKIPTVSAENLSKSTISIEADYVNYAGENQYVKASGNVVVVRGNSKYNANSTTVNFEQKNMQITDGFTFERGNQRVYGTAMDYDYGRNIGKGQDVNMMLHNNRIKGKNVLINDDVIIIDDASQTTCPYGDNPCNHVTSKRLTIYPEWGDVVNDHSVIYFYFVPIMYVPNNVSDMSGGMSSMFSAIPQLGYNQVEGNFAKSGFSYYVNEKLTGTVDMHYLENYGLRSGFTNNYKLDQANRGQVRLHYLMGEDAGFSYGLQHRTLLGVPHRDRTQIIDDFFAGIMPPSNSTYPEFVLDAAHREMSDYQFISYLPKASLFLPHYNVFNTGIKYTFTAFAADILEEDIWYPLYSQTREEFTDDMEAHKREYIQQNWEGSIYRNFNLDWAGTLTPGAIYSNSAYYDKSSNRLDGNWTRLMYYANYRKQLSIFDFSAGYKYTPDESGVSRFSGETFKAGTAEENNIGLGVQVLPWLKLNYMQYYSITEHEMREKTYGGELTVCHWLITYSWSDYYQQSTFGIRLL